MVRPRGAALTQRWRGGAFVARIVPVPRDCDAPASAPRMQCSRVALPSQQWSGEGGELSSRAMQLAGLTRSARIVPGSRDRYERAAAQVERPRGAALPQRWPGEGG